MVAPVKQPASAIKLYPYQWELMDDPARIAVAIWCRQAGKDFTTACKAVRQAAEMKDDWYIVSLTQRQADATFAKCRKVAGLYKAILKLQGRIVCSESDYVEYVAAIDEHFACTSRRLELPGGGSVTSLPGRNPDTLAGLTGNVIFTEFGLFPGGGYDHWRVVFPLITRGHRIVVISTPRGKNTKLFELVGEPEKYSVHLVDIHRAVADGMPLTDNDGRPCTIEAFRELYGDEIGWRREYLIEFTGDLDALLRWTQLQEASAAAPPEYAPRVCRVERGAGWRGDFFDNLAALALLPERGGRAEIGWDVGRRSNLSSVWVNVRMDGRRAMSHLLLMHDTTFAAQREMLCAAMDASPAAVGCGDATGLGMDSNETLATRYGKRWQPVTFTAGVKSELGSLLATAFGDGDQIIPAAEGATKFIATDLYGLQCDRSGERLKLAESPNPLLPESHCDIAYSAALARKAAGIESNVPQMFVIDV